MNTTAKVILFPQSTKKGYPLKIRIIQNRKQKLFALKFYLTESQKEKYWNDNTMLLRKSYPFYDDVMLQFSDKLKELNVKLVNEVVLPKQEPINTSSFSEYFDTYNDNLKLKKQYGLLQKSSTVVLQLKRYCEEEGRNANILFSELNIDLINGLQNFLIKNNIKSVTQRGYLEKLRTVINKAIKDDKYNPQRHPFMGFEFMKIIVEPKHLKQDQFKHLRSVIMDNSIRYSNGFKLQPFDWKLKEIGYKWLFQYYSYGMRVSDMLLLRWSNIYDTGNRINYTMYKTKSKMDIILNNDLLNILFEFMDYESRTNIIKKSKEEGGKYKSKIGDEYIVYNKETEWYKLLRNQLYLNSKSPSIKDEHVFSNIDSKLTVEKDTQEIFTKISTQTAMYNRQLKTLSNELEKDSGVNYKLTSHMARHTFAYLSLLGGQGIYYISQALNHKSVKITEGYLKGFSNNNLDGLFYKSDITATDKRKIDDKLKELINSSNYERKRKIIELFGI